MALYSSGVAIANVALTDTFNTWRVRTNQILADGVSASGNTSIAGSLAVSGPTTVSGNYTLSGIGTITSNTTHSAIAAFTSQINAAIISASGPVTAPTVTANSYLGTFNGNVSGTSGAFSGPVTAPVVTANTLAGTLSTAAQPNVTSVGTLSSLTSSGNITGAKGIYSGPVTAPTVTANVITSAGVLTGTSLDINGSADISGSAIIHGDLTVNGNTITISTTTLSVDDNMIYLNANSAVTNPDIGFAGNYNDGSYAHAGLFRDASDAGVWKFFTEYTPEPDANTEINTAHPSFQLANVAVSGIVAATANVGVLTITDNIKFNNFMREEVTVTADNPAAFQNINVKDQTVQYFTTNADTNWTLNVRGDASTALNATMNTGESLSLTYLVTNGGTGYYQTAMQIDGASVTPKWVNGSAPSAGNANAIDAYSLSIIKTGANTFTVLASQSEYS